MKSARDRRKSEILIEEFRIRSKKCHEYVRDSFFSEKIEHKRLQQALKHYFSYWNDYTHPGLFSLAFEACGGELNGALKPQSAIAMMAAAFDIHDDVIDRSRIKHCHRTVFGRFGQDISLLLGNAFFVKGFTLLGDSAVGLPDDRERQVFAAISRCLFDVGNAHASELDIKGRLDVAPEKYLQIVDMKGASMEGDMQVAALIAGGSLEEVETLREFGRTFGVLATIREEFVDVFDVEELNRRLRGETLPVPIVLALQDLELGGKIAKTLEKRRMRPRDTSRLVDFVFETEQVAVLRKKMTELCKKAVLLARKMENRRSKILLSRLAQSMLEDL